MLAQRYYRAWMLLGWSNIQFLIQLNLPQIVCCTLYYHQLITSQMVRL